jgi:subtilisin-like proprotein convertase family protein
LFFRIGTTVFSDTAKISISKWNHVAVSWVFAGSNATVTFVTNSRAGKTATIGATMGINTDAFTVGNSQYWPGEAYEGYIDEVRLWDNARSMAEIQKTMYVSGRLLTSNTHLIGCWQFEGDLVSLKSSTGMNGTFAIGKPSAARFSGLRDETFDGEYYTLYPRAHSTVVNWVYPVSSSPFPLSFAMDYSGFSTIPDNLPTGLSRSLVVASPVATVTSVDLFMSIEHTYMGDLTVTLKAPNGQVQNVLTENGDAADNALGFFGDSFANAITDHYLPPYGFAKPISTFGTFNSSPVNGTWTLTIVDGAAGDIGILKAWGLRFNNATAGVADQKMLPGEYRLEQNYPNPFNPGTSVAFQLPVTGRVRMVLFDMLGREVRTLLNGVMEAGRHEMQVDCSTLSTGVYYYRLEANGFTSTKKMMLLK